MAHLHEYLNDRGFYIKHSFLADRRLHHVTYQVSLEAEDILKQQGLKEGDKLPDHLFHSLRESGKIFTDRQGVEGTPLTAPSVTENPNDAIYERLSTAARNWIVLRCASHPSARVVKSWAGPDDSLHYIYEGIPEHFWDQLLRVAAMHDGTDFLENLDKSYESTEAERRPKNPNRSG